MALAAQFERELDLPRVAAEVGLRPQEFRDRIRRNTELGRTLGALLVEGGTVQRGVFARVFGDLVRALGVQVAQRNPIRTGADLLLQPPGLSAIPAPRLTTYRTEVVLPEPFAQVRTGGAGRYLIFHLKKAKKLAIFDVSQARVIHQIDLPADDVLYAAGLKKLMLVLPGSKVVQRWSLETFKREKTTTIPGDRSVLAAVMGSASNGPLLLWSGQSVEPWDIEQMRPLAVEGKLLGGEARYHFRLRASADGHTFIGWHNGISPQQYAVMRLEGGKTTILSSPDGQWFNGHWALPGPDGSLVFRHGGGIYTGNMNLIAGDSFKGAVVLPTDDPRFFLAIREHGQGDEVTIYANADRRPVCTVGNVEKTTRSNLYTNWGHFDGEPRVRFLPSARVLLTLPESNDRVVLRRLDLREALDASGQDYLFVRSVPPFRASSGDVLVYRVEVDSKAGGVRFTLDSGPDGMTVSAGGVVRWKVPPGYAGKTAWVALTIKDARGKELVHSFEVAVH
jgi:hypothetical protein